MLFGLFAAMVMTGRTVSAAAPVKDTWTSAHRELRKGLLAHIDGNDKKALGHFTACVKLAAPDTADADSCRIYADMFGKEKAKDDGASKPAARKSYRAAVAAYKNGDLVTASRGWRECLDLSEVATAVRNDCMAAIDLIPAKLPEHNEVAARALYMDGLTFYTQGLNQKATEAWTLCAQRAPRDSDTEKDCLAGLEKLKTP